MQINEVIGVFSAFIVLAGVTVVIVNGGNTARVLQATGEAFANVLRAATGQAAA